MRERLGIYVIYDEQDIIGRSDLYLAAELRTVVSRLIVCVNGSGNVDTQDLKRYTDEIIIRNNVGFDAGAVKEVICDYLEEDGLQNYEELVISNNSFFGPFIPMREIFEDMDRKNCDYWGLSGYMGDESLFWRGIGSYFWVFRRPVIKEHFLENFMRKYVDENNNDFLEVCGIYECKMNYELMKKFRADMYMDAGTLNIFEAGDLALIKYSFPILKRKFFTEKRTGPSRIRNVLRFIADTMYAPEYVEEKLRRLYGITVSHDGGVWEEPEIEEKEYEIPKTDITYEQIDEFLNDNPSVYIYGAGHFATFIWALFGETHESIKGVVTTCKTERDSFHGYAMYSLDELEMSDAILVALNEANSAEVKEKLRGRNCLFLHK